MTSTLASRKPSRLAANLAAGALVLAGVPSAAFALGALDGGARLSASGSFAALTPASVDPRLARFVAEGSNGHARLMRFTPAGVAGRANRSITVAVRIDEQSARVISVHSAIEAQDQVAGEPAVRIAPMRYNLGLSRGYQNFAKAAPVLSRTLSDASIPDLAQFRPAPGVREEQSRFAARIAVDETAKTGSASRPVEARTDQAVDVAGSYRLTRNLDVTAGVRYAQDRARVAPIADSAKQDNQAVYVGTQFRF